MPAVGRMNLDQTRSMRADRLGVISADRVVELLHGTVTLDDLPTPHQMPIEASSLRTSSP